jgi:predicted aldo/keto reductase-like oxidoreductase
MGVIGMKVYAQRAILGRGQLTAAEAMTYVLSLVGVSTVVIGCGDPTEVAENARIAREFQPLSHDAMAQLEQRTARFAAAATYYKRA